MMPIVPFAFVLYFAHPLVRAAPAFRGLSCASVDDLLPSYDYVIIGAGASGLTVANRLSANSGTTVLVIEAGDFDAQEDFITIPGLAGGAIGTKYDWNLTYSPTEAVENRSIPIPLGKVVGGSTKLNRMVYDRGSKCDYGRWETLGNKGWGFDGLLPYFKKNEQYTPPSEALVADWNITYDPSAHGETGNVNVSYSPYIFPTTRNMVNAVKELNIPIALDQANGDPIGGYWCPHNQNPVTVTRSSAEEAYWDTASSRQNLHMITGTTATRLLTKGNVSISGVEFASNSSGPRSVVGVKKEAVLAAGAIHTPQLLQVSGIGSSSHLASINVSTVVDLPGVGQNFHDHVFLIVVNAINASINPNLTDPAVAAQARAEYDQNRTGPYTTPTGDFLAFLPLPLFSNRSAELQASSQNGFLYPDTPPSVVEGYTAIHKAVTESLTTCASLEIIWDSGAFVLGLESPLSRGRVLATSPDMFTAPIADPGFLRNPLDIAILKEGVEFVRRLARTEAMKDLSPVEVVPGTQDVETYIKNSASTLYHPAGTCKIGKREEGGVVDEELKVYGVTNLRVVDASMMPILPAAHTMTTVYAVAEKVAELMLQ